MFCFDFCFPKAAEAVSSKMTGWHSSELIGYVNVIILCEIWSEHLTNRFHVAVHLCSNRSQMTSKCGKNKKVAHKAYPGVSLMFLPHFDVFCDLWLNQMHGNMESICLYNNEKPFLFQNISTLRESRPFAPPLPRLYTKKSHLTWAMIYTKWSNFIGCYA